MNSDARISSGQLFSLLFISRILTTVTFSPRLSDGHLNGDFFINIFSACIFIVLLAIPPALYYKRFPALNPIRLADNSKLLSVIYLCVFLFFAGVSVSRFFIFLTSVIFPEKNMSVFLVIAILLCSYCAFLGIEALARGNAVLLFIIAVGVGVILFFVKDEFSVYNLEPLFYHPFPDSLKSGLSAAGRTVEAAAFLFLAPRANGKMKKSFFICIIGFAVSLTVLFLFLNGVSGEYAQTQLFPFYSLTVIANFPFFERLDAVFTAIWIFVILIKCSVLIYISEPIVSDLFKTQRKTSIIICFAVTSALSLALSINLRIHRAVSSAVVTGVLTFITSFVIPSVLIIKKSRKSQAK